MSSAASPSKPFIRPCTLGDVTELSTTMRQADVDEIHYSSLRSPLEALLGGCAATTEPMAIEWHGKVVAIFGVVGVDGQAGAPWMLGTDDLKRCRSLLRECRKYLDRYAEQYCYLTNAVWSGNEVHIEWIKWLGFTFEGSDVRNGQTFLHFHRRYTDV